MGAESGHRGEALCKDLGLTVLGFTVDEKLIQHLSIVQRCSRY